MHVIRICVLFARYVIFKKNKIALSNSDAASAFDRPQSYARELGGGFGRSCNESHWTHPRFDTYATLGIFFIGEEIVTTTFIQFYVYHYVYYIPASL